MQKEYDSEYDLALKYFTEDIYPLYHTLERYIFVLCGSHDLARDVVADVMVMAWREIFYVRSKQDPQRYLMRCAKNRLIDYMRSHGRIVYIDDPGALADQAQDIVAQLIRADEIKVLFDAIAQLPLLERRIILMYYIYDERLVDIADFTGLPVSTVSTIKRRVLAKLRADVGRMLIVLLRNTKTKKEAIVSPRWPKLRNFPFPFW